MSTLQKPTGRNKRISLTTGQPRESSKELQTLNEALVKLNEELEQALELQRRIVSISRREQAP